MKRYALLLLALVMAFAKGYAHDWMASLPDGRLLTEVSIPGTHDAGTGNGFTGQWADYGKRFGQTQECSIAQQWAAGVRAFDLRPALLDGEMGIFHGRLQTKVGFEATIRLLIDSLVAHPSEMAIVVFRKEFGDKAQWAAAMKACLTKADISKHIMTYSPSLTVGQMRGHLLVLARDKYDDKPVGGYIDNWTSEDDLTEQTSARVWSSQGEGNLFVMDYYETKGSHMSVKLMNLRRMLDIAHRGATTEGKHFHLLINHTSAYSREAMLEDESFATSDGYRDNAAHTNKTVIRYLRKHPGATGIIMMDYAGVNKSGKFKVRGKDLVEAVIKQNFITTSESRR